MRLLIAGVERSGTTWVATALSRGEGRVYVHEPDNPDAGAGASVLAPAAPYQLLDPGASAPAYARLWDLAFAGGWPDVGGAGAPAVRAASRLPLWLRSPLVRLARGAATRLRSAPDVVVVKSVFCAFTLDWIWERYRPHVVVVGRNPLNVVASFLDLGIGADGVERRLTVTSHPRVLELIARHDLGDPPPSRVARLAWWVGLVTTAYETALTRNPTWRSVSHDDLCLDPAGGLRKLSAAVGLPWTDASEQFVLDSNRAGSGYETSRLTAETPDRWRRVLSDADERDARQTLARFPLSVPS